MHFGEPLDDDRFVAPAAPRRGHPHRRHGRRLRGGRGRSRRRPRARRAAARVVLARGRDRPRLLRHAARRLEGLPALHLAAARRATTRPTSARRPSAASSAAASDHFDVLLLHNPDRVGYTSPAVWEAMAGLREAGLCKAIGVAPGPGERLHARRHRLPGALRPPDRLGDADPQPARALAGPARAPGLRAPWRARARARRRLRRAVPRRRAGRGLARRDRPPPLPARPAGSRRAGPGSTSCGRSPIATGSRCCSCRAPGRSPSRPSRASRRR